MPIQKTPTMSQRLAQASYRCVQQEKSEHESQQFKSYQSFARTFPSLVHACGLAQAVVFARAKKEDRYLQHLAETITAGGYVAVNSPELLEKAACRADDLLDYLRLSRTALSAAGWLKRYAEALGET